MAVGGPSWPGLRGALDGEAELCNPGVLEDQAGDAGVGAGGVGTGDREGRGKGSGVHKAGQVLEGTLLGAGVDPLFDLQVAGPLRSVHWVLRGVEDQHPHGDKQVLELIDHIGHLLTSQPVPVEDVASEGADAGVGAVNVCQQALDVVAARRGVAHG